MSGNQGKNCKRSETWEQLLLRIKIHFHFYSHFRCSFFLRFLLLSGSERFALRASLLQRFIVLLRQTIRHTGQKYTVAKIVSQHR